MTSLIAWEQMPRLFSLVVCYGDLTWKVLKYKTIAMTILFLGFYSIVVLMGFYSHNQTLSCGDVGGHKSRMQDLPIGVDKLSRGRRATVISYL